MHTEDISPIPDRDPNPAVCVADGYGVKIHVRHRHLIVEDGYGDQRRRRRFHKATTKLARLVVIGHTGYVTFEALRWLTDAHIGYLHLDREGKVLATSANRGANIAKLRRAQALAIGNETGVALTRWLLGEKLTGQAATVARTAPVAADQIERHRDRLARAASLDELLIIEAAAANSYWDAWDTVPVPFPTADQARIPEHWSTFGNRGSPITGATRRAANPANAILNYLYALLEAETVIATAAVGLDPGIGILHADQPHRDNFALDLMEPVRPHVDGYLLDLLEGHRFRAHDFHETRRGVCRILPPLTHTLAATITHWAQLAAPVAEHATMLFADTPGFETKRITTPLTQANRGRGRTGIRKRPPAQRPAATLPAVRCADCGTDIRPGRTRCGTCASHHRDQALNLANQELQRRRQDDTDPAHGGEAATRRGTANRQHQLANAAWNPDGRPTDPDYYRSQILPKISQLGPAALVEATGLSRNYCAQIIKGKRTPHPRHWSAMQQVATSATDRPKGSAGKLR